MPPRRKPSTGPATAPSQSSSEQPLPRPSRSGRTSAASASKRAALSVIADNSLVLEEEPTGGNEDGEDVIARKEEKRKPGSRRPRADRASSASLAGIKTEKKSSDRTSRKKKASNSSLMTTSLSPTLPNHEQAEQVKDNKSENSEEESDSNGGRPAVRRVRKNKPIIEDNEEEDEEEEDELSGVVKLAKSERGNQHPSDDRNPLKGNIISKGPAAIKRNDESDEEEKAEESPAKSNIEALESGADVPTLTGSVETTVTESAASTDIPVPINMAPTAHDLASAARLAALNHAAQEKEREKEREGKPRLVIHQLVLEDFKSYRGRGVIGPFHKSFSSIVGPNGSGKSNTIDALLFVFGYRATKMRQGKLSELIHNSGPVSEAASDSGELPSSENPNDGQGMTQEDDVDSEEEDRETSQQQKGGKKGKKKAKSSKGITASTAQSSIGLIGQCTVEVWFREIIDLPGQDEFTVVPNSQLVVARTAYRNNSSRYTLNGKTSTFTEVTTLLKGRGIDLDHKRFLILQGEVESIAQMKPKGATEHDEGLLEYLEDIIGSSKYKPDIENAAEKVEKLNDARGTQLNRVKLVEREKSALEERKKEADAYLRDQNELAHNQSALFQVNIHQASRNGKMYEDAVDEASQALDEEIKGQAAIRQNAEALQEEYDTLVADTKGVETEANEVMKQLAVLERSAVSLQEKKKFALTKVKKLRKSLTEDKHAKSEAETWIHNHAETMERVRVEVEEMDDTLAKEEAGLEKIRDSLKGKTEVFSTQIEVLQKELQPWTDKIAAKQANIDLATNERDLLMEKAQSVASAVEEAKAALEKLAADDATRSEELKVLRKEKESTEAAILAVLDAVKSMQNNEGSLRSRATLARQKSDEAKASQSASRAKGDVLTSLTKLKDQGRLSGFYGRLGDLGRIDDKYDVAISTACPGLDNLVTATIEAGQACIDHLRKNNLGRANVMCLDRIAVRNTDRIQTPENAPRLFDLLTPSDPKFAPAFYQLLTNTLVAQDLEQGKRLAFGSGSKRWRVVTLDGQLIDVSGTMSGGGGKPAKGRMSAKITSDTVSPEQVAKCEQEQQVANEALKSITEERQKAEKNLQELKKRLPELTMSISKAEMGIRNGGNRRAEAVKRFEELKSLSKPQAGDVKQIALLEEEIKNHTRNLEHLRHDSSKIDMHIKSLEEKILEVGGVKLRAQQAKVQDLKAQIDHANDRVTKAEVGKAKSEKDAAKMDKLIISNAKLLESTEADLEEFNALLAQDEAEADLVRKSVEQAQEVLLDKKEELAEMKKELDEQVEVVTQFRKRELELKQLLGAQQKMLDDSRNAITYWSEKLGDLQLNEIDEYEEEADENGSPPPRTSAVLRELTEEEVAHLDVKLLKAQISALEERISKTNLDLAVLKEYARREKEFLQRAADLEAVTKERDAAKNLADDLRSRRLKEFMEGFGIISMKLKEMYQMITLGGNAELELVDSLDPFSEGIIFSVMPPKKSWKNISNLSGGEKTLSSLALVFALHVFKPTPLYFMDEIDAALDFRNVSIIANYIKDRTKHAQFIIISLRNDMFELSSRLIGIYKVANQTRSIAIDNKSLSQMKTPSTASQAISLTA